VARWRALLRLFHSKAFKLDRLTVLWARTVLLRFPSPVGVNGRLVLVGDRVKIPRRGKKMPAVKPCRFRNSRQLGQWPMLSSTHVLSEGPGRNPKSYSCEFGLDLSLTQSRLLAAICRMSA
jgi:hypothetical protein